MPELNGSQIDRLWGFHFKSLSKPFHKSLLTKLTKKTLRTPKFQLSLQLFILLSFNRHWNFIGFFQTTKSSRIRSFYRLFLKFNLRNQIRPSPSKIDLNKHIWAIIIIISLHFFRELIIFENFNSKKQSENYNKKLSQ